MKNVVIIDYDMGNVDSVIRAVEECRGDPYLSSDVDEINKADFIILPGVGSFGDAMKKIEEKGIEQTLKQRVLFDKIPFLGICLGMQLLAQKGWEGKETRGLGWIEGEVKQLKQSAVQEKIPHVGWNEVNVKQPGALFDKIPNGKDFYFVHSFCFQCAHSDDVMATTPYCGEFTSAVGRENIYGVQFHPEKSQKAGFQFLRNFLNIDHA